MTKQKSNNKLFFPTETLRLESCVRIAIILTHISTTTRPRSVREDLHATQFRPFSATHIYQRKQIGSPEATVAVKTFHHENAD